MYFTCLIILKTSCTSSSRPLSAIIFTISFCHSYGFFPPELSLKMPLDWAEGIKTTLLHGGVDPVLFGSVDPDQEV